MSISKNRIKILSRYLPGLKVGDAVIVACKIEGAIPDRLNDVGFPSPITAGHALVPKSVGPISEFNATGRDITRKDLPKERRHFTVYKSWNDWHGYPHSGFQNRSVMAYPIEHIPGPIEHIHIAEKDGAKWAVSRSLKYTSADAPDIIHIVNLFLEIFGNCEILDQNISAIALPAIKNLNWRILPKGIYPWEKSKDHFEKVTALLPADKKEVIEDRLKFISGYTPDFIAIGEAGFSGYFVLGFTSRSKYVFESIHFGNATYIFDDSWETVSKLSKSEILKGNVEHTRIIHSHRWKSEIRNEL